MTDWVDIGDQPITFPSIYKPAYVESGYVEEGYVIGGYISYDLDEATNVFTTQDGANTSWQ